MTTTRAANAAALLASLYGEAAARDLLPRLQEALTRWRPMVAPSDRPAVATRLTERDSLLITYADQVREPGVAPLQSLGTFAGRHLPGVVSGLHLLPFYPSSSDDGFSVEDYVAVDPAVGTWADIRQIGRRFDLMVDAVFNHLSAQSRWFRGFLADDPAYRDFFVTVEGTPDLSQVVRPRALPLLTGFPTAQGTRRIWTTFSADQVDLNFRNPEVLFAVLEALVLYVAQGARYIRLDAIAFLWKEIGTSCLHLPQTHQAIQLMRLVVDELAPGVRLITETNVPHQENVSYFGDLLPDGLSTDEAQMVYQFSLAPLTLHTFLTGDATRLANWVAGLSTPAPGSAFFNFTASHDGIGVRPADGLLSPEEIQALAAQTLAHGGHVSYKSNSDGSQSAYELNITWFDALNDPSAPDPEIDLQRFLASQAIMLALAGVPGVYVHSLFGSRNCPSCVAETGRARSINRQKFHLHELLSELHTEGSHMARVFSGYRHLLQVRRMHPAFHPAAGQRVIALSPSVFAVLRTPSITLECALCLTNVTAQPQQFEIDLTRHGLPLNPSWKELLSSKDGFATGGRILSCSLDPYQTRWLMPAAA